LTVINLNEKGRGMTRTGLLQLMDRGRAIFTVDGNGRLSQPLAWLPLKCKPTHCVINSESITEQTTQPSTLSCPQNIGAISSAHEAGAAPLARQAFANLSMGLQLIASA
jgi:hypothetical protein